MRENFNKSRCLCKLYLQQSINSQPYFYRFSKLKEKLLSEINDRFEKILQDAVFIAASVLNPRQKLRVFQPSIAPGLKKPTAEQALDAVKELIGPEEVRPSPRRFAAHGNFSPRFLM